MNEEKSNLQTIFDRVITRLLKQGKPAIGKDGCMYFVHGENLRCAIGAAVEEDVARDLESRFCGKCVVVDTDDKGRALNEAVCEALDLKMTDQNVGFLSDLQDMHDSSRDGEGEVFRNSILVDAKKIATAYGLSLSQSTSS